MSSATIVTDAEILAQVIGPDDGDYEPDIARAVLRLRFTAVQNEQMRQLADKNNRGELTEAERQQMEAYRRVGNFLSLLHSKARLSLKHSAADHE